MESSNSLFSFERLEVWKCSKALVVTVYNLMKKFPSVEKYALCEQLRRSIVSVPSNIAEGSGRSSLGEKVRFIEIAYSSLLEAYCQLSIAADLNYITDKDYNSIKEQVSSISKMLSNLRASFKSKQ